LLVVVFCGLALIPLWFLQQQAPARPRLALIGFSGGFVMAFVCDGHACFNRRQICNKRTEYFHDKDKEYPVLRTNTSIRDLEMNDNEWMHRLNRRPIHWWQNLWMLHENIRGMASVDADLVEYNHLEQWVQVFLKDEEIDIFDEEVYYDNAYPFNLGRFIWHQDILHRIETHHQCERFFRPIGGELPYRIGH
jgi:hypothetical protein